MNLRIGIYGAKWLIWNRRFRLGCSYATSHQLELIDLSHNSIRDVSIFSDMSSYMLLVNNMCSAKTGIIPDYNDRIIILPAKRFKYKLRSTDIHKLLVKYQKDKRAWIDFVGDKEVAEFLVKNHNKIIADLKRKS